MKSSLKLGGVPENIGRAEVHVEIGENSGNAFVVSDVKNNSGDFIFCHR